jgi:hypothetical protein
MITEYKKEVLNRSIEGRVREIEDYQINIDNFRLAIEKIGDDAEMADFKKHLEELLKSNTYEQRKAKIMLEVAQDQLEN